MFPPFPSPSPSVCCLGWHIEKNHSGLSEFINIYITKVGTLLHHPFWIWLAKKKERKTMWITKLFVIQFHKQCFNINSFTSVSSHHGITSISYTITGLPFYPLWLPPYWILSSSITFSHIHLFHYSLPQVASFLLKTTSNCFYCLWTFIIPLLTFIISLYEKDYFCVLSPS